MTTHSVTPTDAQSRLLSRAFYLAAWRWHFYAGLFVIPFLMMLAVTGLVILWFTTIAPEYGDRLSLSPKPEAMRLTTLEEAVHAAYPVGTITRYIAPRSADTPALVMLTTEADEARVLAVNPYDGTILQDRPQAGTWNEFATNIHGKLLWGEDGGPGDLLIETAAGFGVVLLATGLFLWWPRKGESLRAALTPSLSQKGRPFWKSLHVTLGFWIALVLFFFLISGLAWTSVWGAKLVQAWNTFPAEKWENVPLSDQNHTSLNAGGLKEVPWALEETLLPKSGSDAGLSGLPEGLPVNLETINALGRALGFKGRYQIAYPADTSGVWTLSQDTQSYDGGSPTADRTVHVDQYSGKILADIRFRDYSLGGKSMAVGISLHEGQLGWWNIALNGLFCAGVLTLCVSGIVMWWMRRPKGTWRLGAPVAPPNLPYWKGAVFVMLALSLAFPLTGITLLGVLGLDLLVTRLFPGLRQRLD